MSVQLLKDIGLTKTLGLNPPVTPADPSYEKKVDLGTFEGYYKVEIDTGSPLNVSIPDFQYSVGMFDDFIEDLTTIDGFSVELGEDVGFLGRKAQEYLHSKGCGDITISAGSVSISDWELTLNNIDIQEETKANFIPYNDLYDVIVNIGFNTKLDIKTIALSAVAALVITLALFWLIQMGGIVAAAGVIAGLGTAFVQSLAGALA